MTALQTITPTVCSTANPDAGLLAMARRHADLFAFTARLLAENDDASRTPDYEAADTEMTSLEDRIVATPAHTQAGLDAKREFMRHTGYFREDDPGLDTGEFHNLVDAILQLDAERIAAGEIRS
jgi:hypothetical protein